MLKENSVNRNAITVKRILDGEIRCSTYNLRRRYFDASAKEYCLIEACVEEAQGKLSPEALADPVIQECMDVFREKLDIYDRFFRELARREEKEGIGRGPIKYAGRRRRA